MLQALIVLLLVGTNSILAVLTPYSSEVYPTRIRAREPVWREPAPAPVGCWG